MPDASVPKGIAIKIAILIDANEYEIVIQTAFKQIRKKVYERSRSFIPCSIFETAERPFVLTKFDDQSSWKRQAKNTKTRTKVRKLLFLTIFYFQINLKQFHHQELPIAHQNISVPL